MMKKIIAICKKVKEASHALSNVDSKTKDKILLEVAANIRKNKKEILKANNADIKFAQENNLNAAKLDRLMLNENRLEAIASSIEAIAKLKDPVGKIIFDSRVKSNNLHIRRITVPIGVIFAIYEARPNVTSDIASLALKSGNAVILRSGKECFNSSKIIAKIYCDALKKFGVDASAVTYVESSDRNLVKAFLKMDEFIDVVVPRGGKDLVKAVTKNSRIPVFKHLDGNCHSYVESDADLTKARKIVVNAKMRRVGICGATESLLIDKKIADKFLPLIVSDLDKLGCEVRGDAESKKIDKRIKTASNKDYYTEYLDKIIAVKIVKNIDEAMVSIRASFEGEDFELFKNKTLKIVENILNLSNKKSFNLSITPCLWCIK
jgi:glutamate-5-semialdehyde dehydrogenase